MTNAILDETILECFDLLTDEEITRNRAEAMAILEIILAELES